MDETQITGQFAEEGRDTLLDWSVYFALLAKLFGQTAIAFNATSKVPHTIPPALMSKAVVQIRRIARDCGAFRDGMETIGKDFNDIVNSLNQALLENAKKFDENIDSRDLSKTQDNTQPERGQ